MTTLIYIVEIIEIIDSIMLLGNLGISVKICPSWSKWKTRISLSRIASNALGDAEYANRFWCILVRADKVFEEFLSASSAKVALCILLGSFLIWR